MLQRVVQALRSELGCSGLKEGERLASITVLAGRLKVSTNTIRSALTILQQEGLVELRHGSGTYIRRPPSSGKHVALVAEIDLLHPVTSFFFKDMFRRLRVILLDAGYDARVYSGTAIPGIAEPFYSELAGRHLVADLDRIAAVAAFMMMRNEPWVEPVRSRGIPIVSNVPEFGPSVNADREGMVREAIAALAANGCRSAGFICWGTIKGLSESERGDGSLQSLFMRAAREWGLEVRPEWVFTTGNPSQTGAGWEAFREIWRFSRAQPDGLVIDDDQLLPGAFAALRDSGISAAERPLLAAHYTQGAPTPLPGRLIKLVYSPEEHARAMADLVLAALGGQPFENRQVLVPHHLELPGRIHAETSSGVNVKE